ncbi:MAG: hypothetical protein IPM02_24635 [Betaproteobacteria bacterium]|nr:hypothetical protein [Betaproteobacteria bacterium]
MPSDAAEGLVAERERIIVERDAQLAAVNARAASLEELVAERERIIVERDGQLAAMDRRIADANALIVERDGRLLELGRTIEARSGNRTWGQRLAERRGNGTAEDANRALRDEVARRAGWRWWLVLPFLRISAGTVPGGASVAPGRAMTVDVIIPIYNAHDDLVRVRRASWSARRASTGSC